MLSQIFMWRALTGGLCIAVLLGLLGSFVAVRKMSFLGDGIAHASLAGIALALLVGWSPLPVAMMFAALVATGIFLLEKRAKLSGDMAISIMFTSGMALGVVLMSFQRGYQPELMSYLFGNILTVSDADVRQIGLGSLGIILLLVIFYRPLKFVTFDPEGAYLAGLRTEAYELFLYVASAVAIILSIKLVGVVLVSALLITPVAIGLLYAPSFKTLSVLAVLAAVGIVLGGLTLAYYLDFPAGATIVLTGSFSFFVAYLLKK